MTTSNVKGMHETLTVIVQTFSSRPVSCHSTLPSPPSHPPHGPEVRSGPARCGVGGGTGGTGRGWTRSIYTNTNVSAKRARRILAREQQSSAQPAEQRMRGEEELRGASPASPARHGSARLTMVTSQHTHLHDIFFPSLFFFGRAGQPVAG